MLARVIARVVAVAGQSLRGGSGACARVITAIYTRRVVVIAELPRVAIFAFRTTRARSVTP